MQREEVTFTRTKMAIVDEYRCRPLLRQQPERETERPEVFRAVNKNDVPLLYTRGQ